MATNFQLRAAQGPGDTFADASASDVLLCLNNGPTNRAILAGFTSTGLGGAAVAGTGAGAGAGAAGSSKMRLTSTGMSLATGLNVAGTMSVSSNINVGGSLAVGSNLNITGGLTVQGPIVSAGQTITGTSTSMSSMSSGSNALVNGVLTVLGTVYAGAFIMDPTLTSSNSIISSYTSNTYLSTLNFSSNITFGSNNLSIGASASGSNVVVTGGDLLLAGSNNFWVGGNSTTTGTCVTGTLSNLGSASVGGIVYVGGSLSTGGTITAGGAVSASGSLSSTGTLTAAGYLSNAGNVYGVGLSNIGGLLYTALHSNAGNMAAGGNLSAGGNLTAGGSLVTGGAVSVGGAISAVGSLRAGGFLSNVGAIFSTGLSNVGGTLYTASQVNAGGMSVGGGLTAASMAISGALSSPGGILTVGNMLNVSSGGLSVSGGSTVLNNNVTVTGAQSNVGGMSVGGPVTIAGSLTSGNTGIFRNRVLNGDMRIDQRRSGLGQSNVGSSSPAYCADRFFASVQGAGALTVQQAAISNTVWLPPDGPFTHCITATVSAANTTPAVNDLVLMQQRIDSWNITDFGWGTGNASPVVLSFYVRSSVLGNFSAALTYWYMSVASSFTVTLYNVWQKVVVVFPPLNDANFYFTGTQTNNMPYLALFITLASGSGYYSPSPNGWQYNPANCVAVAGQTNFMTTVGGMFSITGVQLERGTQPTPFEFRPYPLELQLCQRYYVNLRNAMNNNVFSTYGPVYSTAPGTMRALINLPTPMRVNPTLMINEGNAAPGGAGVALTGSKTNDSFYAFMAGVEMAISGSVSIMDVGIPSVFPTLVKLGFTNCVNVANSATAPPAAGLTGELLTASNSSNKSVAFSAEM